MNTRTLIIACFCLMTIFAASDTRAQIVYKIPDGVFPMDWNKSGFKGHLFLEQKSPSGIFVAFPNDEENIDQLRERAAKFLAPMVSGGEKEGQTLTFDIKSISSHEGDVADAGKYYLFKNQTTSVQILFFERSTPAGNVLYGYFANRSNDGKPGKIWIGDDMKEPKIFKKFIESMNKAKK